MPPRQKALKKASVTGVVKWFNVVNRYGFINRSDVDEDIFVHQTAIVKWDVKKLIASLGDGEEVLFDVVDGEHGPEAANVTGPDGEPVQGSRHAPDKQNGGAYRRGFYRRGGYRGRRGRGGGGDGDERGGSIGREDDEQQQHDGPPRRGGGGDGGDSRGRGRGRGGWRGGPPRGGEGFRGRRNFRASSGGDDEGGRYSGGGEGGGDFRPPRRGGGGSRGRGRGRGGYRGGGEQADNN